MAITITNEISIGAIDAEFAFSYASGDQLDFVASPDLYAPSPVLSIGVVDIIDTSTGTVKFTNLRPSTEYHIYVAEGGQPAQIYTFTTAEDVGKVATYSQWQDLVSRIPAWSYTTTDPGEGGSLEANHFIGVYE